MQYRRCVLFSMLLILLAAVMSAFFGLRIVQSTGPLMEDVQEYYLSSMTGRLISTFVMESYKFSELGLAGTGSARELVTWLCNPTDAPFELRKLAVDGLLEKGVFLESGLRNAVVVLPNSTARMALQYTVVADWQGLLSSGIGVVVDSALSSYLPQSHATMMVSFVMRTACTIRNNAVDLGIRANFPFRLANLPEVWAWNETYYQDKYLMQTLLYEAILAGLEQDVDGRRPRLLEWASLDVGGEMMTWVYGIVIGCSVIFMIALFLLMLCVIRNERCRCRCRHRSQTPPELHGVCSSEVVYGQCLADVQIDVPDEEFNSKPHLTNSTTRPLSSWAPPMGSAKAIVQS